VLAGAVAAQCGRLLAIADEPLRRLDVERRMHLVLEDAAWQPAATQDLLHQPNVPVLAGVAGGHDGQCLGPELVLVEAAGGHERRELKRLGGRAQEDERLGVANRGYRSAVRGNDHHGSAMDRFDAVAAPHLDQDRRGRLGSPSTRAHPRLA
jgi:hypothetical protein